MYSYVGNAGKHTGACDQVALGQQEGGGGGGSGGRRALDLREMEIANVEYKNDTG